MKTAYFSLALILGSVQAEQVLIENVTVLSPERDSALEHQYVLIRDGRIVSISDKASRVNGEVKRINGVGKFLSPGLMDSHVHLTVPAGLPFPLPADPTLQKLAEDYRVQQPRSYLYHGVTQVLDPSNGGDGIALFNSQAQHPDVWRCGAAPLLNGYPTNFLQMEDRHKLTDEFIIEPNRHDVLPAGVNANDHKPEVVVARIKKSGAICVKVFIEDGFGEASNLPLVSNDTLARVREAAHKENLIVVAHANATDMQRIAVNGNVDVIAHGTWNWSREERAQGQQSPSTLPASVAKLMNDIRQKNIAYQPTLSVLPGIAALFKRDTLNSDAYRKIVPSALLKWYQSPAGAWFKQSMQEEDQISDDDIPYVLQSYDQVEKQAYRSLKYLYDAGHPVLLASDTPSAPTYGNQPGLNTYQEMQRLAEAGIPLGEIFKAGTINNAKQFRLDKDFGSVQVGKVANLLLLNDNPLNNLSAWDKIDKVILHGEVIERESLAAE